jgi:hypothetical protein
MPSPCARPPALASAALALLGGCRQGEEQTAASFLPIQPALAGNQGCNGPAAALAAPVPVLSDPSLGPASQIVAAAGGETLYFTGADASIRRVDFPAGVPSVLVASGTIDGLLAQVGIATPAVISGIAIVDLANLVVVEQTSNTLLLASRLVPDTVTFLAGLPSETPGFADGVGAQIRFSFSHPTQVITSGSGLLYVADPGNHGVRIITAGGIPICETAAGSGAPFFGEGDLVSATGFDTPTGLSVSCGGELLVSELGAAGRGGHRLRSLAIGSRAFFGGFNGLSTTLAGNGTPSSVAGQGALASLAGPVAPVSSDDGFIYWVDSATGILRRYDLATGLADCPFSAGCASPDFTGRSGFSLAITDSGALYVLDGEAATLYRVTL